MDAITPLLKELVIIAGQWRLFKEPLYEQQFQTKLSQIVERTGQTKEMIIEKLMSYVSVSV